ncbi:MAG: 3-oxoacyl-ACP reductase [Chlorogloeopsis fritschii C42_A2020_084]|uniref:3-oxoacyl-[acyl-carrier-protein] synthase III C-terminal domain-containing protein n=1 Tax=Chlorogloeopsis fritschii TaxID=1124 RepID=UPI0019FE749B|nr:3-oxoacyl-[acyl-carrier-protein] synthase III C-terminal domain-containing protein [Chlorogloeopsis fritschii]MBF2006620.1 3-oxoacyl-ACP reductase [Chlorogloeopsis fritschii C42_A2020_084]
MKLESVKVVLPSRKLNNEDIVTLIQQHSEATYSGDLNKVLQDIRFSLKYSGAKERYWLDKGETPISLLSQAVNEALEEAECKKQDIDLLIYTGISRGFLEPGGAYFVANALGMDRVQCFDVLDACMSWTRALSLSYTLLKTGIYRRIMIVNAEFNLCGRKGVYPDLFSLNQYEQITWSFPGYTLGEAATATIVSADPEREWEFHFSSRTDLAHLCTAPLDGYEGYCHPCEYTARNGADRFTSFGFELHDRGAPELVSVFEQLKVPLKEIRAIFPHASSKLEWEKGGEYFGIPHLLYYIYPYCGNVVSASVPTGIALAFKQGQIQRGDRLVGWVGSAGMSFCAYSFTF